jgi:hypothetical protein
MVSLEAHDVKYSLKGAEGDLDERICWYKPHALGYGTSASLASLRLFFHTKLVGIGVPPAELDE